MSIVDKIMEEIETPNILKSVKKRAKRLKTTDRDYISNPDFTAAVGNWAASTRGLDRKDWPPIPPYVGQCITQLITNYGKKGNWRNYTYLDDMKSEATLTCIKYLANFDLEKSTNAFAYFTQLIHNSFLHILSKEKIQATLRNDSVSDANVSNDFNNIILWHDEHDTVE